MKVLIVIQRHPTRRFLVSLRAADLISEVKDLINSKDHSEAITTVFMKGNFEREISNDEVPGLDADLILSERSAYWDLT